MGGKKVEFDWVNDISSDYWDYHNVLVFNDTISYEEFDDLISYALYSKSTLNSLQWDDDGKKEAWNYLTHLVKSYSVGYLIWDKPYLAVSAQVNKSLKNPKIKPGNFDISNINLVKEIAIQLKGKISPIFTSDLTGLIIEKNNE